MESICCMSDPAQPHKLVFRTSPPISFCFSCKGQSLDMDMDRNYSYYYYCPTCDLEFHRFCSYYKPEVSHPFHLSHPLTLTILYENYSTYYELTRGLDHPIGSVNYRKCKCCGKGLYNSFYHCSICDFSINPSCMSDPPPLTITNEKSHDHTLTLFPTTQFPILCDACGLPPQDHRDYFYSCHPCTYMVHRACIELPRVIKITRHPHRLSLTPSLPNSSDFSCGVCRQAVDVNHGQYSCSKGCSYANHSRCATRNDVWDGIDLEGVPEETNEDGDMEPFLKIDENTIKHFLHDHHLRLHQNDVNHLDEHKFCQACTLPILNSDRYYNCLNCDFVFHETCASLPRIQPHPLHIHPLTLRPFPSEPYKSSRKDVLYAKDMFLCNGCHKRSYGFVYECGKETCDFKLDVICASLPDPVTHGCHHDHPLFFNLTSGKCMRYEHTICSNSFLECIKCKSFLGLNCATLPTVARYKYDRHLLTLCYGVEDTASGKYWCELCESGLDPETWFYTCDLCSVTLHVKCLLGRQVYIKPNDIITIRGHNVETACNNGNSRPICHGCAKRCVKNLVLKRKDKYYCTLSCLELPVEREMKKMRELIRKERPSSGMRCLTAEMSHFGLHDHYNKSSTSIIRPKGRPFDRFKKGWFENF